MKKATTTVSMKTIYYYIAQLRHPNFEVVALESIGALVAKNLLTTDIRIAAGRNNATHLWVERFGSEERGAAVLSITPVRITEHGERLRVFQLEDSHIRRAEWVLDAARTAQLNGDAPRVVKSEQDFDEFRGVGGYGVKDVPSASKVKAAVSRILGEAQVSHSATVLSERLEGMVTQRPSQKAQASATQRTAQASAPKAQAQVSHSAVVLSERLEGMVTQRPSKKAQARLGSVVNNSAVSILG